MTDLVRLLGVEYKPRVSFDLDTPEGRYLARAAKVEGLEFEYSGARWRVHVVTPKEITSEVVWRGCGWWVYDENVIERGPSGWTIANLLSNPARSVSTWFSGRRPGWNAPGCVQWSQSIDTDKRILLSFVEIT